MFMIGAKKKIFFSVVCVFLIWPALSACAADTGFDQSLFHPPQTGAEKALSDLLMQDKNDENLYEYLLGRSGYNADKDPGYDRWVTQNLVQAVREKEKQLVQENCDGEYRNEICGIDIHLPLCGQDVSDYDLLFHTIHQTDNSAQITYAWQEQMAQTRLISGPVFILIKQDGLWKLDGLDCGEYRFNLR